MYDKYSHHDNPKVVLVALADLFIVILIGQSDNPSKLVLRDQMMTIIGREFASECRFDQSHEFLSEGPGKSARSVSLHGATYVSGSCAKTSGDRRKMEASRTKNPRNMVPDE